MKDSSVPEQSNGWGHTAASHTHTHWQEPQTAFAASHTETHSTVKATGGGEQNRTVLIGEKMLFPLNLAVSHSCHNPKLLKIALINCCCLAGLDVCAKTSLANQSMFSLLRHLEFNLTVLLSPQSCQLWRLYQRPICQCFQQTTAAAKNPKLCYLLISLPFCQLELLIYEFVKHYL